VRFTEIEFKYKADDISLEAFKAFCVARKPSLQIQASGYDHFYQSAKDEAFSRHRVGADMNQLTFKRKTSDANNIVRTEHNIDLHPSVSKEQVAAFLSEFGYEFTATLYKSCFVFQYDWYILVYYIVFDAEMKELGRFIEIEASETFPWRSEAEARASIDDMERLCKPLGIQPQRRVKRSLFEMFASKKS